MPNKHTPGPWSVDYKPLSVVDTHGLYIAVLDFDEKDGHEKANARLIAAAPVLLKTLREITTQLSAHPEAKQGNSRVHYCMHLAGNAIIKAESES